MNNTPILDVDRVYAEIEINSPGVPMQCHLKGVDTIFKVVGGGGGGGGNF